MPGDANWFHARVEPVSRADGKSAVGLAAYITGEKLWDEENKRQANRNHPGEVLGWGSVAPKDAPSYLVDPKQLGKAWNDVQRSERRINSHLANHERIALSAKLSEQDHIDVMTEIARRYSDRYQLLVTWSVHKPTDHGDERNWHGHLASNMRRVGPEGFGPKAREIVDKKTRSDERRWQRQMYADVVNERLAFRGIDERVSPLSYAERGIDREPTQHRGNKVNLLEIKGVRTKIGDHNRAVQERNFAHDQEQRAVDERIAALHAEINDLTVARLKRVTSGEDEMEFNTSQADWLAEDQTTKLTGMSATKERYEDFLAAEEERKRGYAQQAAQKEQERRLKEQAGDITSARDRWDKASHEAHGRDPFLQMVDAVQAEKSRFIEEQNILREAERKQDDPEKRKLIELRRHIEACDFMALGHDRNAALTRVITGNDRSWAPDKRRAEEWRKTGDHLRDEREQLQKEMKDKTFQQFQEGVKDLDRQSRGNGKEPPTRPQAGPNRSQMTEDQRAVWHYEQEARKQGKQPNEAGRQEAVDKWREAQEEHRLEAQRKEAARDERPAAAQATRRGSVPTVERKVQGADRDIQRDASAMLANAPSRPEYSNPRHQEKYDALSPAAKDGIEKSQQRLEQNQEKQADIQRDPGARSRGGRSR